MKDYYSILGVDKSASDADIKKAYRQLSKKWHPDRNPGNKEAEEKFKEINEAYDVIGDKQKRQEYDNPNPFGNFGSGFSGFSGFGADFDPFDGFGMHRNNHQPAMNIPKGDDIVVDLNLSIEDIYNLGIKKYTYIKKKKCHVCGGASEMKPCSRCNGTGMVFEDSQRGNMFMRTSRPCPSCHGTGVQKTDIHCDHCNNTGLETEIKNDSIDLSLIKDYILTPNVTINLGTKGSDSVYKDGMPGNLLLRINHTFDSNKWGIENGSLIYKMNLNVFEMINGCKKEIVLPDGKKVSVNVSECSKPNKVYRMSKYGLRNNISDKSSRGPLYIKFNIEYPDKLTETQKELLSNIIKEDNNK